MTAHEYKRVRPDGVIYRVSSILARQSPVEISCVHADLYHGWGESDDERPGPTARIIYAINTAAGPVRCADSSLLVEPGIAERLRTVCDAKMMPAEIAFAYHKPVDPVDGFDRQFQGIPLSSTRQLSRYMRKHRELWVPAPELVRVEPRLLNDLATQYNDVITKNVPLEHASSWPEVMYSRKMVKDHGMIRCYWMLLSEPVYEVLRPYVEDNLYFATDHF